MPVGRLGRGHGPQPAPGAHGPPGCRRAAGRRTIGGRGGREGGGGGGGGRPGRRPRGGAGAEPAPARSRPRPRVRASVRAGGAGVPRVSGRARAWVNWLSRPFRDPFAGGAVYMGPDRGLIYRAPSPFWRPKPSAPSVPGERTEAWVR